MSNAALATLSPEDPACMTEPQRACLLHVLRNCASALEGMTFILSHSEEPLSTDELHSCLKGVVKALTRMDESFQRNSFCAISSEDCQFVGPFVGCNGEPRV